uniref:Uncharacterized protein n=1 Tax=Rhizophora mucronata TaxID=61149 RepID=A0A2P2Q021_RHIMU
MVVHWTAATEELQGLRIEVLFLCLWTRGSPQIFLGCEAIN